MDGAKVFIDGTILEKVEAAAPRYMSRTAWVNHLLDRAIATLPAEEEYACAGQSNA